MDGLAYGEGGQRSCYRGGGLGHSGRALLLDDLLSVISIGAIGQDGRGSKSVQSHGDESFVSLWWCGGDRKLRGWGKKGRRWPTSCRADEVDDRRIHSEGTFDDAPRARRGKKKEDRFPRQDKARQEGKIRSWGGRRVGGRRGGFF